MEKSPARRACPPAFPLTHQVNFGADFQFGDATVKSVIGAPTVAHARFQEVSRRAEGANPIRKSLPRHIAKFRLKYACHPSSSSHHALSQSDAGSELADVHPRSNETSVSRPLARTAYLNRGRRESVPSHSLLSLSLSLSLSLLSLSRHRHLHSSRGAIVKREMTHSTERPSPPQTQSESKSSNGIGRFVGRSNCRPADLFSFTL